MVSYPGNVSIPEFSHVWCYWLCSCDSNDLSLAHKKFRIKTIYGEPIQLYKIRFSKGQVYGGLLFGFGWAMTGACPGPLFALIGSGTTVIIVTLLSAIAGTWVYGFLESDFRTKLLAHEGNKIIMVSAFVRIGYSYK